MPDVAARNVGSSAPVRAVCALLDRWQRDHDPDAFDSLVTLVRPPLERVVASALRRRGIQDPAACDEAMTIVLDHLARMGGAYGPSPKAYEANRGSDGPGDPGWVYVLCLARSRARDVCRSRRRRERRQISFSACDALAVSLHARSTVRQTDDGDAGTDRLALVQAALDRLAPRQRAVVEMLLAGKNQAVIAHAMGLCEGTVSRLRARAIASLRRLLVT